MTVIAYINGTERTDPCTCLSNIHTGHFPRMGRVTVTRPSREIPNYTAYCSVCNWAEYSPIAAGAELLAHAHIRQHHP